MDFERHDWPRRTGFLEACVHSLLIACEVHEVRSKTVDLVRARFAKYNREMNGREEQLELPLEEVK